MQTSELMVHNTHYFKYNYCTQRYKSTEGTQNITTHLIKNHGWDGLTTIQLKRKRENMEIEDVLA